MTITPLTIIKSAFITAAALIMTTTTHNSTPAAKPATPNVIPIPHCFPCAKLAEIPMPNPNSPCMPTRGCGKNLV